MSAATATVTAAIDEPIHQNKENEQAKEISGKLEMFEGKLCKVVNSGRVGWWRFHEHYDRNGYCDNPGRGY